MNIFIAKLDYYTEEPTLREAFEAFGAVDSVKIVMDRESGRSKGFGFVEMPNDDEARNAIADLDGSELDGRNIVVKEARPREERSNSFRNNRGGGGYRSSYRDDYR